LASLDFQNDPQIWAEVVCSEEDASKIPYGANMSHYFDRSKSQVGSICKLDSSKFETLNINF
jgi:hypothetical protein